MNNCHRHNQARWGRFIAALAVLAVGAGLSHAATISTFHGTGVDGSGNLLAAGAVDSHYSVSPGGASFVIGGAGLASSWVGNTASSQWISAAADTLAGGGPFTYTTNFLLSGLDPATAQLSLDVAADNQATTVLLNGNAVGTVGFPGWTAFTPLTITSGFLAGLNTLVFAIPNNDTSVNDGPTGLQVRVLSATANAIPEPTSWALAGVGLLLVAAGRRRSA